MRHMPGMLVDGGTTPFLPILLDCRLGATAKCAPFGFWCCQRSGGGSVRRSVEDCLAARTKARLFALQTGNNTINARDLGTAQSKHVRRAGFALFIRSYREAGGCVQDRGNGDNRSEEDAQTRGVHRNFPHNVLHLSVLTKPKFAANFQISPLEANADGRMAAAGVTGRFLFDRRRWPSRLLGLVMFHRC
jgi:hypothetical protein